MTYTLLRPAYRDLVDNFELGTLERLAADPALRVIDPGGAPTFARASTAHLDGVEVAAGTPRYPHGRNLLSASAAAFDSIGDFDTRNQAEVLVGEGREGRNALVLGRDVAGSTAYAYATAAIRAALFARIGAGATITFSVKVKRSDGQAVVTSGPDRFILNLFGITYAPTISGPDAAGWYTATETRPVTGTAVDHLGFIVYDDSAAVHHLFSDWQIERASSSSPWRPGGPRAVLVEEGTTNLLAAGTADGSSLTGWGAGANNALTLVTTPTWQGASAVKMEATAAGNLDPWTPVVAVTAGTVYTFTAYVRAATNARSGRLRLSFRDAAGAQTANIYSAVTETLPVGAWLRLTVTATAPANSVNVYPYLAISSAALGDVFYVDGLQLESGKAYPTQWHPGGATRDDDHLAVPASLVPAPTDPGTIDLTYVTGPWASASGSGDAANDLTLGAPGSNGFLFRRVPTGTLMLEFYNAAGSKRIETTSTDWLTPGRRIHARIAWSSAGISLYVDGALVGSVADTWNPPAAGAELNIGGRGGDHANNVVEGLRISDRRREGTAELAAYAEELKADADTVYLLRFPGALVRGAGGRRTSPSYNLGRMQAVGRITAHVPGTLPAGARLNVAASLDDGASWRTLTDTVGTDLETDFSTDPTTPDDEAVLFRFELAADDVTAAETVDSARFELHGGEWWDVAATTERLYDRLPEHYRIEDARPGPLYGDRPLLRYLANAVDQAGELELLLDRMQAGDLADPDVAERPWLVWLGQLVGVNVTPNLTDTEARDAVRFSTAGWRAGTKLAVADAAKSELTGTRYARVYDHRTAAGAGGVWDVLIVTRETETPDVTAVLAAVARKGAKPAGVVLHHKAYAASWDTIEATFTTWDALEAAGSWQNIEEAGL